MSLISLSEQVILSLANFLKQQVPEILAIYDEFPDTNIKIQTPSASILTANPVYTPLTPRVIELPDPNAENKMVIQWTIGHYEFPLQLDLWAAHKRQRNALFERVFMVLNNVDNPAGLNLPLYKYYNQFAHYHVRGYDLNESMDGSMRQERRARIDLIADANAVVQREEYAMTTIEINNNSGDDIVTENILNGG